MAAKLVVFLALAVYAAQGQTVTEIRLPDETRNHISNPLIPLTIGIPQFFFDTLISCHLIFPNGVVYETFPVNNLNHAVAESAISVMPGCSVGFRNAPASMSGTYELLSRIDHILDGTSTLQRQKYHLTFTPSDLWAADAK